MSAILITDGFIREWKRAQLRAQTNALRTEEQTSFPRLPIPGPVPEEFGDFMFELISLVSAVDTDTRPGRRSWGLNGSQSLYTHAALEATRLGVSRDDILPVASLAYNYFRRNGTSLPIRAAVNLGRLYVLSRPPAYLTPLSRLVLGEERPPEFGHIVEECSAPSNLVLPFDWYDVPLFLSHVTDTTFTWHRLRTFNPESFSSPEEMEAHLPNFQTEAFYERARRVPTPYIETQLGTYAYTPHVRLATTAEAEAWFRNFQTGLTYRFADIELPDILINYVGAVDRHLLADHPLTQPPGPRPNAPVQTVATDVQPPAGSVTQRPYRSANATLRNIIETSPQRRARMSREIASQMWSGMDEPQLNPFAGAQGQGLQENSAAAPAPTSSERVLSAAAPYIYNPAILQNGPIVEPI